MNRPVFFLIALVALFPATGAAGAAPVPDEEKVARRELERLKERLPEVLTDWAEKRWYSGSRAELRIVRRTGPAEAKVWVLLNDLKNPQGDQALTLYLRYYRGAWFTTHFEGTWPADNHWNNKAVRFPMLDVDEAGGK